MFNINRLSEDLDFVGKDFKDFENYYYYWDNDVTENVFLDFLDCNNLNDAKVDIKTAREKGYMHVKEVLIKSIQAFSRNWASVVYPKPRMVINCDGLSIAFEPMKHGRFTLDSCGDEGPYAIRVSSQGAIRPCLLTENPIEFLRHLRSGASDEVLMSIFKQGLASLPGRMER